MDNNKVWLITGASKGLGLALVKKLLALGYCVAATSRNIKKLSEAVGNKDSNFLPLEVDLLNELSVTEAISVTIKKFGKIDVVVNNAGYGLIGTLEELSDEEARKNFDVNVFGSLNVIRKVMPHLRKQKSGTIFNISSIGGFTGNFPGFGIYCATKFAVVGFTESLASEVKPFGISATVVYPGYFRTNFLESDSLSRPQNPIEEYTDARALELMHVNEIKGNQTGDPDKLAAALISIASNENPPLHLFLGTDSVNMALGKIENLQSEIAHNKPLSISTDF